MDGLRGVAALQVVALHYATAFLPGLGMLDPSLMRHAAESLIAHTPLFALLNGYGAVYLFFLLSGVALTRAFAHAPYDWASSVLRRIVRLGLPMALAIALSALLLAWQPDPHLQAAPLTGSISWLGGLLTTTPSVGHALRQIFVEGMFAGYRGVGIAPGRVGDFLRLLPLEASFDPPLWSLHLEFVGSLLVIALVALRARLSTGHHRIVCVVIGLLILNTPMVLFVLGHLCEPWIGRPRPGLWWRHAGWVCVALGLLLSAGIPFAGVRLIHALLPPPVLPGRLDLFHFQPMLAQVFLFAGVVLLPCAQRLLGHRRGRQAGRLSFSLYLVHLPLLFTVTCWLFVDLTARVGHVPAVLGACVGGLAVTVPVALLFEHFVDRPAVWLSRRVRCGTSVGLQPNAKLHRGGGGPGSFLT